MAEKKEMAGKVVEEKKIEVVFTAPVKFEGEEVERLDLSGLRELKGKDVKEIDRILRRMGHNEPDPELTADGAVLYACRATGRPVEFFDQLPMTEARRVKVRVLDFLLFAR